MNSHFWDVIRDTRVLIHRQDDALYILHTPIGEIAVHRFIYREEVGYIFLQGIDQNGKERTIGFSEQQVSTFPFEIRMKSTGNNGQIKFNPSAAESIY